jgi:hypothetical protein
VTENPAQCRNCHQTLSGEYCFVCGQRDRDIRLGDIVSDAAEDISHTDSRLWRTVLGLLFHPGQVTADYLAGRRASYVPPLRLYFILSFFLFLVVSQAPIEQDGGLVVNEDGEIVSLNVDDSGVYFGLEPESPVAAQAGQGQTNRQDSDEPDAQELNLNTDLPDWLAEYEPRFKANVTRLEENPGIFTRSLLERLPQVMFVLLPLFAMLLQLCYLFSRFHYLQHLVFSLHYHSLAFLLFLLSWVLGRMLPGNYTSWVLLLIALYLPAAMIRVYESGTVAAIGKSMFMAFAYSILVLVAFSIYALLNLVLL